MNNQKNSFLNKIDTILIGFIIGLIVPMFMLVLLYFFKFQSMGYSWEKYVDNVSQLSTLPSFIRNCVFLNLPVFFLFNLLERFNLCKGIFIASLLYIAAMLIVRFAL